MQRLGTAALILLWSALLLGGAFRPQAPDPAGPPRPEVGYPAPPLDLVDLNGSPVSLSDLRGKAVFLNFWASWCGPCRLEMPEIERLQAELGPDAVILTVNVTRQELRPDAAATYMSQHGYTFPVALDLQGRAELDYRVVAFPTSLFLSPDGIVTARISGPLSRSAMAGYLRAAGR